MWELWINEQIDAAGANPWGDGCYDLWTKCRVASAGAYARWMEFENDDPERYLTELELRRKAA